MNMALMSATAAVGLVCTGARAETPAAPAATPVMQIVLDGKDRGRVFEGLGGLSAGASTRLLIEYPEPQRSQVLDYLFKPKFGAGFQHLKVEIGGDINSTSGTEPGIARTREEFDNPKPEYFNRGYEWWLLKEARKRNPAIFLDVLQWGAPDWIGEREHPDKGDPNLLPWKERMPRNRAKFYSQDNAEFIAAFINGARTYHGLEINYCGIWNEMAYDAEWIKVLRRTLDAKRLKRVQIVAADQTGRWWHKGKKPVYTAQEVAEAIEAGALSTPWDVTLDMSKDKELMDAVSVIGVHYVGLQLHRSREEAQQAGKPLWSSEDGPWRGDWRGAKTLAKMFNRNYIGAKTTKTIIWSLITSYYDNLPIRCSGPMKAQTPWSGFYEVQPAIWAIAHTTQFAEPGWQYLDGACKLIGTNASWVALKSPDGSDYSLIVETVDASAPLEVRVRLAGGLVARPLHAWRSAESNQFEQLADVAPVGDEYLLALEPGSIYSFTTTTGQKKGAPDTPIPPSTPFPLPYADDFEGYAANQTPRLFSDQGGAFETAQRADGKGKCLKQIITRRGIDWSGHPSPAPYTVMGSRAWRDYEVACDVSLDPKGYATIGGRIVNAPQSANFGSGYWLQLDAAAGEWRLAIPKAKQGETLTVLKSGPFMGAPGSWHRLKLRFAKKTITASIDGAEVATLEDSTFTMGTAGFGSGWNVAEFDNFVVKPK
jgi:galactosylceramidase